ncbi:MAG: hypothetical protein IPK85_07375 [Gemmatimonadetes bacterium]|nr:hypothetical protein [Gemmatimonadota bacterium]
MRHVLHRFCIAATTVVALVAPALSAQAPTCALTLDSLDAKLRQNYAGFHLEVRGPRRAAYDAMRARLSGASRQQALDGCFPLLTEYTAWFGDPHLFVFQNQAPDTAERAANRAAVLRREVDVDALRREWVERRGDLDPIEGIWYDGSTELAVVRASPETRTHFVAVLTRGDTAGWDAGDERALFIRRADGGYDATLLTRGFARLELVARIHRGTVLRLSPGMWGKRFPIAATDSGYLDTTDVHRPRVVVRERSVVVSLPSHDPRHAFALDRALRAADTAIRARPLLIVDLRGNEGGGSMMSRALHPYITTAEARPTPFDSGAPVMWSSPAQVAYARRAFGPDTSAFVRSLVSRLKARPGTLVPLEESPARSVQEPSHAGPWKVAVLVDGGTVSAAEVLVLRALRSSRAVVIGEPTAGALDYQSVSIVGLGTGDRRWALGYPTIAAHAELPARGMRGQGIQPTIPLSWPTVGDAYTAVERLLR